MYFGFSMIKEKLSQWDMISCWIGRIFGVLPLPPFFYTAFSLFAAVIALLCAYTQRYWIAILLFTLAALCDIVDGAVARFQNKASALGAFLDGVFDRFIDFALIFSYFFFDIQPCWFDKAYWICLTSFVVILPSFNVAYANHRHAVHSDDEKLIWRLMNRGEMYLFMLAVLIISLFQPIYAGYILMALVGLSVITIIQTIIGTVYHARFQKYV